MGKADWEIDALSVRTEYSIVVDDLLVLRFVDFVVGVAGVVAVADLVVDSVAADEAGDVVEIVVDPFVDVRSVNAELSLLRF